MTDDSVVRFVIPGPPKAWKRAGHRIITPKGGKPFTTTYTNTETRSEQGVLRFAAYEAMGDRPLFTEAIELKVSFFMAVPESWSKKKRAAALGWQIHPTGKPDLDNLAKMMDAFKHVLWRDDAQVSTAYIWKRYSAKPRTVVEIRPAPLGGAPTED